MLHLIVQGAILILHPTVLVVTMIQLQIALVVIQMFAPPILLQTAILVIWKQLLKVAQGATMIRIVPVVILTLIVQDAIRIWVAIVIPFATLIRVLRVATHVTQIPDVLRVKMLAIQTLVHRVTLQETTQGVSVMFRAT